MALELLHRCRLQNQNNSAVGGSLQIKGRQYYNEIPLQRHMGSEIRRARFFQTLAEKGLLKQSYWVNLFYVSLDAPGT